MQSNIYWMFYGHFEFLYMSKIKARKSLRKSNFQIVNPYFFDAIYECLNKKCLMMTVSLYKQDKNYFRHLKKEKENLFHKLLMFIFRYPLYPLELHKAIENREKTYLKTNKIFGF